MADKLTVMLPAVTGVLYALTAVTFVAKKQSSWALVDVPGIEPGS